MSLERPLPARHLVEQDAEREDVGAVVDRQPLRLLGRHVGDRPHDAPVLGDRLRLAQWCGPSSSGASPRSLARPKSSTFTRPSAVSITFSGLRSRCRMPWRCAAATASVSAIASARKRSIAKPCAGIARPSVSPSTCSMVRKRRPSRLLDRVQHHDRRGGSARRPRAPRARSAAASPGARPSPAAAP